MRIISVSESFYSVVHTIGERRSRTMHFAKDANRPCLRVGQMSRTMHFALFC